MKYTTPIEMPRSTHYGNNYFEVYSHKVKRICHFFSNLEYFNFLSLEINPEVAFFCEQPLKINFILNNESKSAIFDMWVSYKDGREEFQEVKYESELNGDDNKSIRSLEQIRREEQWCKDNEIDFVVRTDRTIPQGRFFLSNANLIAARLRRYVPTEEKYYNPKIVSILENSGSLTVADLISNKLLPFNHELSHLCYMYEKGLIDMDIESKPLGYKTEVSLC